MATAALGCGRGASGERGGASSSGTVAPLERHRTLTIALCVSSIVDPFRARCAIRATHAQQQHRAELRCADERTRRVFGSTQQQHTTPQHTREQTGSCERQRTGGVETGVALYANQRRLLCSCSAASSSSLASLLWRCHHGLHHHEDAKLNTEKRTHRHTQAVSTSERGARIRSRACRLACVAFVSWCSPPTHRHNVDPILRPETLLSWQRFAVGSLLGCGCSGGLGHGVCSDSRVCGLARCVESRSDMQLCFFSWLSERDFCLRYERE